MRVEIGFRRQFGEVRDIKKNGTLFWRDTNISTLDHAEFEKIMAFVHYEKLRHSDVWPTKFQRIMMTMQIRLRLF